MFSLLLSFQNNNLDKPLQNHHNHHLSNGHINGGSSMSELNMMDINCSNNSSMDHMDQMDQMQMQHSAVSVSNPNAQTKALNHQYRFHAALTRTISTPQPQIKSPHHLNQLQQQQQHQQLVPQQQSQQQQDPNVATLVNTLIENLGNINLHRKLERTQSEPLPQQVNASR